MKSPTRQDRNFAIIFRILEYQNNFAQAWEINVFYKLGDFIYTIGKKYNVKIHN